MTDYVPEFTLSELATAINLLGQTYRNSRPFKWNPAAEVVIAKAVAALRPTGDGQMMVDFTIDTDAVWAKPEYNNSGHSGSDG